MPLLLGAAALRLLCGVAATRVQLVAQESTKTQEPVGPIPAGPRAAPKSLRQAGVPVEATRPAVPADNPKNLEKVALGEEIFFDGRLSVDGTVASSTCHDPARPAATNSK